MSKVNKVNRAEVALPGPHNIPKINDGKKKKPTSNYHGTGRDYSEVLKAEPG